MPNKFSKGIALSLLISGSISQYAIADDANSLENQILNGEASPSVRTAPAKPAPAPESHPAPAPEAKAAAPGVPDVITAPNASVSGAAHPDPEEALKKRQEEEERDREARVRSILNEKEETPRSSSSSKPLLEREQPTAVAQPSSKPKMLFGRIEQLAGEKGATFPSLKAQTPMVDTRTAQLVKGQTQINNGVLTGMVVHSFPTNFSGNWGGHIVLQTVQVDPNYYRVDPEEAARTTQAMRAGMQGDVNFMFNRVRGQIDLAPSRCLFMVPGANTQVPDEMKRMYGGGNAAMGAMMAQVAGSMPVPVVLEFGDVQANGGQTTVSGNKMRQIVIKNEVRQLGGGAVEEQIVTQTTTWDKRTNRPRTGYGETVMRFSTQSPTVMYVNAATVEYGPDKKFLCKMMLYGSIGKGVVMNTDPMSAMTQGMGGLGGTGSFGGMPGLGALGNMFGAGAGPAPTGPGPQPQMQIPGMPAGGLEQMMKMFGGQ